MLFWTYLEFHSDVTENLFYYFFFLETSILSMRYFKLTQKIVLDKMARLTRLFFIKIVFFESLTRWRFRILKRIIDPRNCQFFFPTNWTSVVKFSVIW